MFVSLHLTTTHHHICHRSHNLALPSSHHSEGPLLRIQTSIHHRIHTSNLYRILTSSLLRTCRRETASATTTPCSTSTSLRPRSHLTSLLPCSIPLWPLPIISTHLSSLHNRRPVHSALTSNHLPRAQPLQIRSHCSQPTSARKCRFHHSTSSQMPCRRPLRLTRIRLLLR